MNTHQEFIQTFPTISHQRSMLYRWFADWLARERENQDFMNYQTDQSAAIWSFFSVCGLEDSAKRFRLALENVMNFPDKNIDLAADFATAFLLAADYCATPYASWYLEPNKRFYGDIERQMRTFLQQHALKLSSEFKEPSDHLSVFLSLFAHWIEQDSNHGQPEKAALEQAVFLKKILLSWLPYWEKRCGQLHLQTDVYPALAKLLVGFIDADLAYLEA